MTPNKTTVAVNEDRIGLQVKIGQTPGYLIVLNNDPKAKVKVLFPATFDAEDAYAEAGRNVELADEYVAPYEGIEKVKAIVFRDKDKAQELLTAFKRAQGGDSSRGVKTLELEVVKTKKDTISTERFYTSELVFEVRKP